jgi:hypothetical protein
MTDNLPYIEAFSSAFNVVGKDWFKQIFKGFEFILFRMPGIESLWNIIALRIEPLGISSIDVINLKNGIAGHLTYESFSHKLPFPMKTEIDSTLMAPGFVGWFYLVAGLPAIVLGSLLIGLLSVLGWKFLDRRCFESGPVAQVFFLWMLFMALIEGTLDNMVYMFLVGLITIVALEVGLRMFIRRAPSENFNL